MAIVCAAVVDQTEKFVLIYNCPAVVSMAAAEIIRPSAKPVRKGLLTHASIDYGHLPSLDLAVSLGDEGIAPAEDE